MKIEKYPPSLALSPFVKEYIFIESVQEFDNKTIPDTAMVLSLRYAGNVQKIDGDSKISLPASGITGLRKSARYFHYSAYTANLLVIFNEGGLRAFSKVPCNELYELNISSENLFNTAEINELLERLAESPDNRQRLKIIEAFLVKKLNNNHPDLLVKNAVQLIKQNNGDIRIKDLAADLHISQDPFEKRFRAIIGSTAKQYASIIRLRHLINSYPSYDSLTEASFEAGYFDQSHFIKDFRLFTGQTPKDFFKSSLYW